MELYFQTRDEWRDWLEKNHDTSESVWLIYFKKSSGKSRIPYDDAVEEALCFGWIDSKVKRVNQDYYIQLFSRRRAGSRWSKNNIDRVRKLIELGKMEPSGLAAFREVLEKPHLAYHNSSEDETEIPVDLMEGLKSNKKAISNFLNFPFSARRMYLRWLNGSKRAETREKRILKIIDWSEKNIRPGMM
ncbi:MAG: YdeI/OmpD-associated family protein [Bacteroidales bacterium]|jgi:uncharacterized protein YdeI (YjbR/CyaY-like superfamily)